MFAKHYRIKTTMFANIDTFKHLRYNSIMSIGKEQQQYLNDLEFAINFVKSNIGKFFLDKRTSKKWSIRQLSKDSGVSTAVISDLENARSLPRIDIIIKLAMALEVPVQALFEPFTSNYKIRSIAQSKIQRADISISQILQNDGFGKIEIQEIIEFIEFKKQKIRK